MKKRLFAHAECIPIDRLRWYRATFLFYWSFAFIEWTNGVCVCCFCSLVTACPRRSDCHFKHFIGFWNSDCIHFPSFVNTNGGFECVQNSKIPSFHWGGTNRLAITQKEILIIARILIHHSLALYIVREKKRRQRITFVIYKYFFLPFSIIHSVSFVFCKYWKLIWWVKKVYAQRQHKLFENRAVGYL